MSRRRSPIIAALTLRALFTSRLLGIRHQCSDVGSPRQNGRIERLFGTLKEQLDRWTVADVGQLERSLALFSVWYNDVRPHQSLGGLTPREAWDSIDPERRPARKADWFSAWDGLLTGFVIRR